MDLGDKTIKIIGGSILAFGLIYGVPSCVKWAIESVNQGREDSFEYFRSLNETPDTLYETTDTIPTRDTIPSSIEYNAVQRSA